MTLNRVSFAPLLILFAAACAPSAVIAEIPEDTAQPKCTVGNDRTCNGDASASALWGICQSNRTCSCKSGFVVDSTSGKCVASRIVEPLTGGTGPIGEYPGGNGPVFPPHTVDGGTGGTWGGSIVTGGSSPIENNPLPAGGSSPVQMFCVPGLDTSCNPNESIVSANGTCSATGSCQCKTGFVNLPATGKCVLESAGSVVALGTIEARARSIALASGNAYWVTMPGWYGGELRSVSPSGGVPKTLVSFPEDPPPNIAAAGDSVYWAMTGTAPDFADGSIMKVDAKGGTPVALATEQHYPGNIVVHGSTIVWLDWGSGSDRADGRVLTMDTSGSTPVVLASTQRNPGYLDFDGTNVVWTLGGTSPYYRDTAIMKVPVTGGTPVALATDVPIGPLAIGGNQVFWSGYPRAGMESAPAIRKVGINGDPAIELLETQAFTATDLVSDGSFLYWAESPSGVGLSGVVKKIPVGGGESVTLAQDQFNPTSIALDATQVYWTTSPGPGEGTVMARPK